MCLPINREKTLRTRQAWAGQTLTFYKVVRLVYNPRTRNVTISSPIYDRRWKAGTYRARTYSRHAVSSTPSLACYCVDAGFHGYFSPDELRTTACRVGISDRGFPIATMMAVMKATTKGEDIIGVGLSSTYTNGDCPRHAVATAVVTVTQHEINRLKHLMTDAAKAYLEERKYV